MEECPLNVLEVFQEVLQKAPHVNKAGFSLNIFDIPDHFDRKWEVIDWELQWWKNAVDKYLYTAAIDTTFALYKKGVSVSYYYDKNCDQGDGHHRPEGFLKAIRTGYPFMARHLPWYVDSNNLSDEEIYVINHSEIPTHWTVKKTMLKKQGFIRLKYRVVEP